MASAYPTQSSTDQDPFAGGSKTPSLSWKGLPIGSAFTLQVLEPAKLLHSRNFETNEPDYWDVEKTQPKMSAVVNVRVVSGPHSVGEERSVWAQKPSDLFAAIATAQQTAGSKIATGGTLHLRFHAETPHENKRFSAIKHYQAKYEPPAADAFGAEAPVAAPRYAQPAQAAQTAPAAAPMGWPQRLAAAPTMEQLLDDPKKPPLRW